MAKQPSNVFIKIKVPEVREYDFIHLTESYY
jgi:hypothetical protein